MDPSDLENMTPEQIEQLIALGVIPEQQSDLQQQMKMANELRNTKSPEMYGNGRVMVAANPLEHLGVGLQRYAGQRDMKNIQQQQKDLRDQQVAGRSDFMKNYLFPAGPRPQSIKGPLQPQAFDPTKIAPPKMSF